METNTETAVKPTKKIAPKKTKKVAKKASAKKTASAPRVSADGNKKIKILAKENPKREGTNAFKRFALYKNGMKVSDLFEIAKKKGLRPSLRWDLKHKLVTLH